MEVLFFLLSWMEYDFLWIRVGQKEYKNSLEGDSKTWGTICYGIEMGKREPLRPGDTVYYEWEWARKNFILDKSGQARASKTWGYLLWRRMGQSNQDPGVRFIMSHQDPGGRLVTDKSGPERATKTQG